MPPWLLVALSLMCAYLVGSMPFGLLIARGVAGVDIRTVGSGNVGATNVGRVVGRRWFFVVFVLDALKGISAVLLISRIPGLTGDDAAWVEVGCGLMAVIGHVFCVWLRFRGGKGVATAAGAVFSLHMAATGIGLGAFLVVLATTRMVSVGSLAATAGITAGAFLFDAPLPIRAFTVLLCIVVPITHRANIRRIVTGDEPRLGRRTRDNPATEEAPHA